LVGVDDVDEPPELVDAVEEEEHDANNNAKAPNTIADLFGVVGKADFFDGHTFIAAPFFIEDVLYQ